MPDVMAREGIHPETPRVPYTPGWDLVGVADRLGDGVSGVEPGQLIAAMPIHGAYAEFVCLLQSELVPVPSRLDAAEAVGLVLNYITAYQMLHRSARVGPGQRARRLLGERDTPDVDARRTGVQQCVASAAAVLPVVSTSSITATWRPCTRWSLAVKAPCRFRRRSTADSPTCREPATRRVARVGSQQSSKAPRGPARDLGCLVETTFGMTQRVQRDRQDHVGREPGPTDGPRQQLAENPRDRELTTVFERLHERIHRRGIAKCCMTPRVGRRVSRAALAADPARDRQRDARRATRTRGRCWPVVRRRSRCTGRGTVADPRRRKARNAAATASRRDARARCQASRPWKVDTDSAGPKYCGTSTFTGPFSAPFAPQAGTQSRAKAAIRPCNRSIPRSSALSGPTGPSRKPRLSTRCRSTTCCFTPSGSIDSTSSRTRCRSARCSRSRRERVPRTAPTARRACATRPVSRATSSWKSPTSLPPHVQHARAVRRGSAWVRPTAARNRASSPSSSR